MRRREFVQKSAFAAAGFLALPTFLNAAKKSSTVGLQLYTLRDTISKDPKGVLKKVATFGYKELETFGYRDGKIFTLPFAEFGSYVKSLGMKVTSGHYGLDIVKSDGWEKAITDAKSIGQKYMVLPYLQDTERKSIDDYKRLCETLNKAGEVCNKHGIRFQYHNHAFEFDKLDGQIPYDVMLADLDPKKVGMEMDIFWVINAGQDPVKYFEKYPGRFEQWHVKDMDKNDRKKNVDVGNGSINWKEMFTKAKLSGMKHFYVEHDTFPAEPIQSAEADIKYLKTIL